MQTCLIISTLFYITNHVKNLLLWCRQYRHYKKGYIREALCLALILFLERSRKDLRNFG